MGLVGDCGASENVGGLCGSQVQVQAEIPYLPLHLIEPGRHLVHADQTTDVCHVLRDLNEAKRYRLFPVCPVHNAIASRFILNYRSLKT